MDVATQIMRDDHGIGHSELHELWSSLVAKQQLIDNICQDLFNIRNLIAYNERILNAIENVKKETKGLVYRSIQHALYCSKKEKNKERVNKIKTKRGLHAFANMLVEESRALPHVHKSLNTIARSIKLQNKAWQEKTWDMLISGLRKERKARKALDNHLNTLQQEILSSLISHSLEK